MYIHIKENSSVINYRAPSSLKAKKKWKLEKMKIKQNKYIKKISKKRNNKKTTTTNKQTMVTLALTSDDG